MEPSAVLLLHLFDGQHFATESGELRQFLLDFYQTFLSLPVSGFVVGTMVALQAVLFAQSTYFGDLRTETRNLLPKNLEVIHYSSIMHREALPGQCV
jgi:hypothetical protein